MDVHDKLDEVTAVVEGAKAMPLSASCVVNRAELLALLEEVRATLPEAIANAEGVLREREDVVAEGQAEADKIIARAYEERARLVSKTEVFQEAAREAERVVAEARSETEAMRDEVDDYVDTKLANFEIVLTKTLAAVERGREKLRGRHPLDALRAETVLDDPLPG